MQAGRQSTVVRPERAEHRSPDNTELFFHVGINVNESTNNSSRHRRRHSFAIKLTELAPPQAIAAVPAVLEEQNIYLGAGSGLFAPGITGAEPFASPMGFKVQIPQTTDHLMTRIPFSSVDKQTFEQSTLTGSKVTNDSL